MSKRFLPLAALAVAFSPVAFAEPKEISVELLYDGELLAEEAGAISVMKSLKSQARDACTTQTSLTYMDQIDHRCVKSVVSAAITKIVAERDAAGLETADVFAKRATIQLAALDQG